MPLAKAQVTVSGSSYTDATTLFDAAQDGGPCAVIIIKNTDASIAVRVFVPGLHDTAGDGARLSAGDSVPFHLGWKTNGIGKVKCYPESGSPKVDVLMATRF